MKEKKPYQWKLVLARLPFFLSVTCAVSHFMYRRKTSYETYDGNLHREEEENDRVNEESF